MDYTVKDFPGILIQRILCPNRIQLNLVAVGETCKTSYGSSWRARNRTPTLLTAEEINGLGVLLLPLLPLFFFLCRPGRDHIEFHTTATIAEDDGDDVEEEILGWWWSQSHHLHLLLIYQKYTYVCVCMYMYMYTGFK